MIYKSIGEFTVSRPRLTIAVVLLLTLFAALGLRNIHFVSDFDSTLPNRSPLTRQILDIEAAYDSRSTLAFVVSGGSEQGRIAAACALGEALERQKGVAAGRVYGFGANTLKYLTTQSSDLVVTGLADPCWVENPDIAAVRAGLGPQEKLIFGANGALFTYADLDVISGDYGDVLYEIDAIIAGIAKNGVSIDYTGQPAFLAQNDHFSKRIAYFFPIIMALILILHWEALRSVQAVVIPILTGFLATLIGLGLYGYFRLPLDTYTVLAPILILAVAAGHSVQLLKRYMEEVAKRAPAGARIDRERNEAAIVETIRTMGPVLTIAVAGASACLFALLLLDVSALARFGLLAGLGVVAALGLEMSLIPAIRAIISRPLVKPNFGDLSKPWEAGLRFVGRAAIYGKPSHILLGIAAVAVFLVIGVLKVQTSHSAAIYLDPKTPVRQAVAKLVDEGAGPYALDVEIVGANPGAAFDPDILNAAKAISDAAASNSHVVATLSAPALVLYLKCAFTNAADCDSAVIENRNEASEIWTILYGGASEAGLINADESATRVRLFLDTDETPEVAPIIGVIEKAAAESGVEIRLGGSAVMSKALADGIIRVCIEKAILLLAIVAFIGGLVFRSFKVALLFALPSLMTIAANFAFLGWSGVTLNVATAAVATIAVGVGLDYLVYLTFRLREALAAGKPYLEAIESAHHSAGGAAICVAMAVTGGYAILVFSPNYLVHHWIAALVPLTMLSSLFGALFVFPALLRLFQPAFEKSARQTAQTRAATQPA